MTIKIGNKDIFGDFKITIDHVTFEEFLEFAEEDINCELLNGVLVINSPANFKHQVITRFLLTYLDLLGLELNAGRALSAPFVIKLEGEWAPEPDIIFYSPSNRERMKATYFDGAPDIVVEILAPRTRDDDLTIKLPRYMECGLPEVWIIDPDECSLVIYHPDGSNQVFFDPESIIKSDSVPQVMLRLKWIFNEEANPLRCFDEMKNLFSASE